MLLIRLLYQQIHFISSNLIHASFFLFLISLFFLLNEEYLTTISRSRKSVDNTDVSWQNRLPCWDDIDYFRVLYVYIYIHTI